MRLDSLEAVYPLLILVGSLLGLIWVGCWFLLELCACLFGVSTQGVVTRVQEDHLQEDADTPANHPLIWNTTYRPTIVYLDASGQRCRAVPGFGASWFPRTVGETLPIRYLPDYPGVIYFSEASLLVQGLATAALGFVFVWSILYTAGAVTTMLPFTS